MASFSSLYDKALVLNDRGVSHFVNGNYEQARSFFRESLEVIKVCMAESNNENIKNESSVDLSWSKNGPIHAELGLHSPSATCFIFRRALIVASPHQGVSTKRDLTEESIAIIYNLALAHMMSGFLTNCSSLLDIARKFFEIVAALRRRRSEASKLEAEQLLDTAIFNNLGWIHQEFCEFQMAQQFFLEVSARLGSLNHSEYVDKQDCEGFITNLVLDAHPQMAAAA